MCNHTDAKRMGSAKSASQRVMRASEPCEPASHASQRAMRAMRASEPCELARHASQRAMRASEPCEPASHASHGESHASHASHASHFHAYFFFFNWSGPPGCRLFTKKHRSCVRLSLNYHYKPSTRHLESGDDPGYLGTSINSTTSLPGYRPSLGN